MLKHPNKNGAAHFYFGAAKQSFQPTRENQESRLRISRENHCTPEYFRMECVGKTCCAATANLELAKGFEPPTL
jgi:hypothetical protein